MNRTLLAVCLSLAAGFAAGAWTVSASQPDAGERSADTAGYFDAAAPTEQRIAALERIVAEEREARLVLEEQLQELFADLDRIDVPELRELLAQVAGGRQRAEEARAAEGSARRESRRGMRDFRQMRTGRLVQGGFSEARANEIVRLEDAVRMDALHAEYEARRQGGELNPWDQAYNYQAMLRQRLGDAEYEKYLQANGSQASITVREVIDSSPAGRAGLRPGDRIVSYDGERVFSMIELKNNAFDGDPGEDVIVDVERDGQRMQLVLPRGPLGITGGGAGTSYRYPFGG